MDGICKIVKPLFVRARARACVCVSLCVYAPLAKSLNKYIAPMADKLPNLKIYCSISASVTFQCNVKFSELEIFDIRWSLQLNFAKSKKNLC